MARAPRTNSRTRSALPAIPGRGADPRWRVRMGGPAGGRARAGRPEAPSLSRFEAAEGLSEPTISDLVTVDSPLGGVPERIIQTCIDIGYCTDGSVANYLADLYANAPSVERTNAARAAELASAGTRVSAWGNQS